MQSRALGWFTFWDEFNSNFTPYTLITTRILTGRCTAQLDICHRETLTLKLYKVIDYEGIFCETFHYAQQFNCDGYHCDDQIYKKNPSTCRSFCSLVHAKLSPRTIKVPSHQMGHNAVWYRTSVTKGKSSFANTNTQFREVFEYMIGHSLDIWTVMSIAKYWNITR